MECGFPESAAKQLCASAAAEWGAEFNKNLVGFIGAYGEE